MKTIIAGSRNIQDYETICACLLMTGWHITEVVSGGARGVDELGEKFARQNDIPLKMFPANWKTHGRSAGMLRNQDMAEYADALVAVWNGRSKGTAHMIEIGMRHLKTVQVFNVNNLKEEKK